MDCPFYFLNKHCHSGQRVILYIILPIRWWVLSDIDDVKNRLAAVRADARLIKN